MSDTVASRPDLWAGSAWLVVASRPGHPSALALSSYRRRLADWEHHLEAFPSAGQPPPVPGVDIHVRDPDDLLGQRAWTSAELDVLLDTVDEDELAAIVRLVAGHDTESALAALDARSVPVNANRRVEVTGRLRGAVDLTVPTLPSRRDEADRPLAFACRRLRLIAGRSWYIAAWGRLEGQWRPDVVRWPHFGVPSRTAGWRSGRFAAHQSPTTRLAGIMDDLCEHIEYQLGTWTVEQELWEQNLFASLAAGPTTFAGLRLGPGQRELSQLAEFLALMRTAQRGLARRPDIDHCLSAPAVRGVCGAAAERLDVGLAARRDRVREAFALVADIAAGEQAHLAERQRAATERLQDTITVVTTALLIPALVASVYGANLRELVPGARGDVPTLVALMVASSTVTTLAIRGARSRLPLARSIAVNGCVGAVSTAFAAVAGAGMATGRLGGLAWAAATLCAAVVAASAILGLVVSRRQRSTTSHEDA